jgi:thiamine-phosphate pyrophosphorylase
MRPAPTSPPDNRAFTEIIDVADYQFTPAAERALSAAARWMSNGHPAALGVPELLLGLLAEAESRAGEMLTARGVSETAVRQRWPELRLREGEAIARRELSPVIEECLLAASARLADFPRPLVFATEHLLLGLIDDQHELSGWLAGFGFDAETVAAEIHRRHGYAVDADGTPEPLADVAMKIEPQADAAPPIDTPLGREDDLNRFAPLRAPAGVMVCRATRGAGRVLDAAANRAREALRVIEDYARFVLDDQRLTARLKELRHRLTAALASLPAAELLAARDTPSDVGTSLTCAGEQNRPNLASVVTANCKRLQESLRSLEEYGKLISVSFAADIEQMRYESYALEGAVVLADEGRTRLAAARLYVLVDGGTSEAAFASLVGRLTVAGVHVLQLRDKRLGDRELLGRARRLRELTRGTETLFIMNDRPDLAAVANADGVHVGQDELGAAETRAVVGPHALVGVSTHSVDQARRAAADGADYIGVGPTFVSGTKVFDSAQLQGVDLLRSVVRDVQLPAFAIGGIDAGNLPAVLAAGITRIAVSGAVVGAADPAAAVRELLAILNPTPHGQR